MFMAMRRVNFIPSRRSGRVAALICLAVCVFVFILAAYRNIDRAYLALAYASVILAFPACFLAVAIAAAFDNAVSLATGAPIPPTLIGLAAYWALVSFLGYVQWFILVPRLLRKLNAP